MWHIFVKLSIVVVFVRSHRVDTAARDLEEENSSYVRLYGEVNEIVEDILGRGQGIDFKPTLTEVFDCFKKAVFNAEPYMCFKTSGTAYCEKGWHMVYTAAGGSRKRCCKDSWGKACFNLPWCGAGSACYMRCDNGREANTLGRCVNECTANYEQCWGSVCTKKGYCGKVMASFVVDTLIFSANAIVNFFGGISPMKTFIADQIKGLLLDRTMALAAGQACTTLFDETQRGFSIEKYIPNLELTTKDLDVFGIIDWFEKLNGHGCT
eukprot:TRINITY_DN7415_c0_g2_i1.p1 TRINITY_DN7415_c0_g2~~TRINITY_DN7415_c0_g2_i1.p1  ORF type:complete len:266 (+),score=26.28 TRINITY_DN7415_c0_g2_i1:89-886(+)